MTAARWDPRGTSLLLMAAACLLPFLQPRHFPPLRTFYDEWIALALGVGAIGFAAASRNLGTRVPVVALWLGAFALFLTVRALVPQLTYPQGALLWATYSLYAALLVTLAYCLVENFGREHVCEMLAVFLLAGAILNAIAGVLQVVGIPKPIDAYVSYLHGTRAIGNVGQSNLYANYLALGEASLVYLYSRGRVRMGVALAAGVLMLTGAALAAARTSTLYSIVFAILGLLALRARGEASNRRLGYAAIALAFAGVILQWLVPIWVNALGFRIEGGFDRNVSEDWDYGLDESTSMRLLAWQLAVQIFSAAPWLGVGPGEFAGAAFSYGLSPQFAAREIMTSPHNLVLQLLSETGLVGTALVAAGIISWALRIAPAFMRAPSGPLWWVVACASVQIIHALLEYPFWYAHFLALAALVMGAGTVAPVAVRPRALRNVFVASAVGGAVLLGVHLRDYFRFELASPVYAGRSLETDADLQRDLETLAGLRGGLFAPRAELWLFLALPYEGSKSEEKIEIGNRVMRTWPIRDVVIRQCIFLALAGRDAEATALFRKALQTFAYRHKAVQITVAAAPDKARRVLEPEMQSLAAKPAAATR